MSHIPELSSAEGIHSHTGTAGQDSDGLLEDDQTVQVSRDHHVDRTGGEGAGKGYTRASSPLTPSTLVGEECPVLAEGDRRSKAIWKPDVGANETETFPHLHSPRVDTHQYRGAAMGVVILCGGCGCDTLITSVAMIIK